MADRKVKVGDRVVGGVVTKILPYDGPFKHFFDCFVIVDGGKKKAYFNEWREHYTEAEHNAKPKRRKPDELEA